MTSNLGNSFDYQKNLSLGENSIKSKPKPIKSHLSERILKATSFEDSEKLRSEVIKTHEELTSTIPETKNLDILDDNFLGLDGMKLAVYNMKLESKDVNCFVCKDLGEFQRVIKLIGDSNYLGKMALIVRSNQFENDKETFHHFTPVLIEKKLNKPIDICILDSIGVGNVNNIIAKNDSNYPNERKAPLNDFSRKRFSQNLYNRIVDANIPNAKIFISSPGRQRDDYHCSMFALNDVKHFFRNNRFFEDIRLKGQLKEHEKDPNLKLIYNISPGQMKLTQFSLKIEAYIKANQNQSGFDLSKKVSKVKTFEESIEKGKRDAKNAPRPLNAKAINRFSKLINILDQYLKEKDINEIKIILNQIDSLNLNTPTLNESIPQS